jgi:hypothetical protein
MSVLKDRIASMVFAFGDDDRKHAVRLLASDVAAVEQELADARQEADLAKRQLLVLAEEHAKMCKDCSYRDRAWRAEADLDRRYGLRKELQEALGVADAYGDQALEEALRTIARLRERAAYWKATAKAIRTRDQAKRKLNDRYDRAWCANVTGNGLTFEALKIKDGAR